MFFFDTCNAVAARKDQKPKYWQLGRRHLGLSFTLWRHNEISGLSSPLNIFLTVHNARIQLSKINSTSAANNKFTVTTIVYFIILKYCFAFVRSFYKIELLVIIKFWKQGNMHIFYAITEEWKCFICNSETERIMGKYI